ncbi:superoxide dismutase [Leuconostoc fallax]|uniref:superoxide dismutase n=1 Tax=Leuconostoc fallax TaxID=1251 RepID=UPI00209029F4|nr:superoxide dismutase [Leuconostoc fallax]MCO6183640.1 superoxide dismutase [Leuconostoc fallax]
MTFTTPALPYEANALEPYIDAKTMTVHHDKHHQTYVNNLNNALKDYPEFSEWSLEKLLTKIHELPEALQTPVRNQGGGHANHSLFWELLTPDFDQKIPTDLAQAIDQKWGDFNQFKSEFTQKATGVFGSGWAWLVKNQDNELEIMTTANQDSPIMSGKKPLLGLDVWEHAYYLKYQNRRPEYIEAFWHIINWQKVDECFNH